MKDTNKKEKPKPYRGRNIRTGESFEYYPEYDEKNEDDSAKKEKGETPTMSRLSAKESMEFLRNLNETKAVYSGDFFHGTDDEVYFFPEQDIGNDIQNLLVHIDELQEENNRLIGENHRLSKEKASHFI